jgi:hypothetical protein
MRRHFIWAVLIFFLVFWLAVYAVGRGWFGIRQEAGEITSRSLPVEALNDRESRQRSALLAVTRSPTEADPGSAQSKQILFGDLHVHTTFSLDAYMISLPLFQGEGVHPPADACDFARFCAELDFWSINDHAEGLTPYQWAETKETVRQCNAVAGDPESPDMVTFLGWEWTQKGDTPEDHYGHKNVILRDTAEDAVPVRPIASKPNLFPSVGVDPTSFPFRVLLVGAAPGDKGRRPYLDAALYMQDRQDVADCPSGAPVRDLPGNCLESAPTPGELFAKLDDWGFPYLVIPHGNTWGFYTPPRSSWDRQLADHEDPERDEFLVEVFSGHGNCEEYRDWRAVDVDEDGRVSCPEPVPNYLPSCWRAGEIIRDRCSAAGESAEECDRRASEARQNYADAGAEGHVTVPAAKTEDWLDAGQCRDCYMPAFNYRPAGSSQYALAITNFDDPERPKRFKFGFLASSDNHTARPGTGYKEINRREMTDTGLSQIGEHIPKEETPAPRSVPIGPDVPPMPEFERFASFFGTGGLVAVHSAGRDRGSIWESLERKEVYGTSGDRILLWFDLLLASDEPAKDRTLPMGSKAVTAENPRFQVRAVGAFHQKPGCPEYSTSALSPERLHHLCRGECYNPSDERKLITRIEVVRIRPQSRPGEPVADLIEDPWRVLACDPDRAGCSVRFADPDFATAGRDTIYYVRAIQEPTPTINAAQGRCEYDETGRCIAVNPCFGNTKTDYEDDCLVEAEERAWSSPIFLGFES